MLSMNFYVLIVKKHGTFTQNVLFSKVGASKLLKLLIIRNEIIKNKM